MKVQSLLEICKQAHRVVRQDGHAHFWVQAITYYPARLDDPPCPVARPRQMTLLDWPGVW